MRAVLDTNVFISGIFWKGNFSSQIIDAWRKKKFDLVISVEILDELLETLKDFKIQVPEDMTEEWKNLIIENSIIVEPDIEIDIIKEDPQDNKFIEAAITGKADLIISQDKHLLNLKEYQKIKIIRPKEAMDLI